MNGSLLLSINNNYKKGLPIDIREDIKEVDSACKVLDIGFSFLEVEKVEASFLLGETQHLY